MFYNSLPCPRCKKCSLPPITGSETAVACQSCGLVVERDVVLAIQQPKRQRAAGETE